MGATGSPQEPRNSREDYCHFRSWRHRHRMNTLYDRQTGPMLAAVRTSIGGRDDAGTPMVTGRHRQSQDYSTGVAREHRGGAGGIHATSVKAVVRPARGWHPRGAGLPRSMENPRWHLNRNRSRPVRGFTKAGELWSTAQKKTATRRFRGPLAPATRSNWPRKGFQPIWYETWLHAFESWQPLHGMSRRPDRVRTRTAATPCCQLAQGTTALAICRVQEELSPGNAGDERITRDRPRTSCSH